MGVFSKSYSKIFMSTFACLKRLDYTRSIITPQTSTRSYLSPEDFNVVINRDFRLACTLCNPIVDNQTTFFWAMGRSVKYICTFLGDNSNSVEAFSRLSCKTIEVLLFSHVAQQDRLNGIWQINIMLFRGFLDRFYNIRMHP